MSSVLTLEYTVVDAFTDIQFRGNSAAVVILDSTSPVSIDGKDDATLQLIAREFNLSETAFVTPRPGTGAQDGSRSYDLRWFTPTSEVDLCGHATLASGFLLSKRLSASEPHNTHFHFHTHSGVLTTQRLSNGAISLTLPGAPVRELDGSEREYAVEILGKAFTGEGTKPEIKYVGTGSKSPSNQFLLVELETGLGLEKLPVDPSPFTDLPQPVGVILTTRVPHTEAVNSLAFLCRVFAPSVGIPEDPVTGSAYSLLGPYWHQKLGAGHNQRGQTNTLLSKQVSARGGDVGVQWNEEKGTVVLEGKAVIVAKGELCLPT